MADSRGMDTPTPNDPRLLPLGAMASRLGISPRDLREEALAGRVPCVSVGRGALIFDPDAVEESLARRARGPAETRGGRDAIGP